MSYALLRNATTLLWQSDDATQHRAPFAKRDSQRGATTSQQAKKNELGPQYRERIFGW